MIYLTLNQLSQKLGRRSRSSIYRDVDAERLPRPIKLGGKLYWIEDQVDDLLASKMAESNSSKEVSA